MTNPESKPRELNSDSSIRLGVNVDHVGTLRNARGGIHPDPILAARLASEAGADIITVHLREDRRHILDDDISRLIHESDVPINMEMAATEEMASIAIKDLPSAICLVPEQRRELTTEGGLDVRGQLPYLIDFIGSISAAGIKVATFVDPDERQVEASLKAGADAVELHVGSYCEAYAKGSANPDEFNRLVSASEHAINIGLECHAGHGLNYGSAAMVAKIGQITELNIGHFIISEAVFTGLRDVVTQMRRVIDLARSN